ncbi:response regulator receiver domain-containing protein [Krasilnikovia cinnamomea]|uniref:Response regulator receiver domain-containing protein n=1 Tax=Krasilnikovia cinnamomea TaxID=349313 RepID=A0A4Q7ZS03_9ACTN|nr:response regulator [Krasilnikovia cinnamomea]RZU53624.1 response regulator receiver domain-containing protein [Krasilnikovia cinnamomea]
MALVVVAEDEDDIRSLVVRMLHRAGHEVIEAPDGAVALQAVRERHPDAVISDLDLPRMSGVELSQAIRTDANTAALPVILVSGSLLPGDRRAVDARATAILTKPFLPRELVACLDKALTAGHDDGVPPMRCP